MADWTDDAIHYLKDTSVCPRCGARAITAGLLCGSCRADLSSEPALAALDAAHRAAAALVERAELVAQIPTVERVNAPTPAYVSAPVRPITAAPSGEGSRISLQSILAVAGATMIAVAAIVFTFLNGDLTTFGVRTTIIAGVTALFVVGSILLGRTSLKLSAEAVAALSVVFLGLDVWAFSQKSPDSLDPWVFAAIGTGVGALVLFALARLTRLRAWLASATLGIVVVPAFLGYATADEWGAIIGHLATSALALIGLAVLPRLLLKAGWARLERGLLLVVMAVLTLVVAVQFGAAAEPAVLAPGAARALVLLVLALLAVGAARVAVTIAWSATAGVLAAAAGALVTTIFPLGGFWWLTAAVGGAGVVTLGLALIRPLRAPHRDALLVGAWATSLAISIPAAGVALLIVLDPVRLGFAPDSLGLEATAILGICAGVSAGIRALRGQNGPLERVVVAAVFWITPFALITLAGSESIPLLAGIGIALVAASALFLLVLRNATVPLRATWRVPSLTMGYVALAFGAASTWADERLTVPVNVAVLVVLALAARTTRAQRRFWHVGVGYAWALAVAARGFSELDLPGAAVLALTVSVGAAFAIVATFVPRIRDRDWLAVLAVTGVPFLIGIATVLAERSGWTALSTGLVFLLALALTVTARRRPGAFVRSAAAGILVPSLAVVAVSLGAQVLATSGSPVVLPVIAALVAVVLPFSRHLEALLVAHGVPAAESTLARRLLEISCLITATITVALALVRVAAGLETSLLVLTILGFGAAATARFTARPHYWVAAIAAWTGALWCFWALLGVTAIEPFVLPPALVATVIGAITAIRGHRGAWLFAIGLAVTIAPSLVTLALVGQADAWGALRVIALLAASLLLLGVAWLARSRETVRVLLVPTGVIGIAAAAGGALQAMRFGVTLDRLGLVDPQLDILPVLGLSVVAAALGTGLALTLRGVSRRAERWLLAPAVGYLVAGPALAVHGGWLPVIIAWVLELGLLALLVAGVIDARNGRVRLPPAWFLFALAWCVSVAGWSERLVRVEGFSLPLGIGLILAGVITLAPGAPSAALTANSWPVGSRGSWGALGPGIAVLFLPLLLATGTDPQTWRAIIVIALALVAVLAGALRRLAAPFILGLAVMPVENIIVFAGHIGRTIGAAPWWITLGTAGAVMIGLAATYERRSAGEVGGVAARLRDLR